MPYLQSGYYFDDSLNASHAQHYLHSFQDYWGYLIERLKVWTFLEGRLYPLGVSSTVSSFFLFKSLTAYRIFQVSLILANLYFFYLWLRTLKLTQDQSLLTILVCTCLFQVRNYHDPMTSYGALLQIAFLLGISSLITLNRYFEKEKRTDLFLSYFTLTLCLLAYETCLIFSFVAIVSSFFARRKKVLLGFVSLLGLYIAASLFLRLAYPPRYAGVQLSIGLGLIRTYFSQLSAAIPLSYPIFGRTEFVRGETLFGPEFLSFKSALIFTLYGVSFFFLLRQNESLTIKKTFARVLPFACILFFISPLFVAISKKYQQDIGRIGHAYLPVYFGYFGFALLLTFWILRKPSARPLVRYLIAGTFAFIFTLNLAVNEINVSGMNFFWKQPRALLEQAAQSQQLSPLCSSNQIIHSSKYYWINSDLISALCKKEIEVTDLHYRMDRQLPIRGMNFFTVELTSPFSGWIGLGKVDQDISNVSSLPEAKTIWKIQLKDH
jgi:hypothetical protein